MPSLLLALLLGLATVQAEEAKSSPAPKDAKAKSSEKEESETDPTAAIPAGMPVYGIKIPYTGPDGKTVQMIFDAKMMTKLDDENIQMENLKIEVFGDDGKKFDIELPRALFNLHSRVLTGKDSIKITREDFKITGDALEFYTKTRFGKILGNVKMIILSTENIEN